MIYLRSIPYIIILIFICYIGYKEYDANKSKSDLKSEIIKLQNDIHASDLRQYELTIKMMNDFNESQDKRMKEMKNEIDKIDHIVTTNNNLVTKLHSITKEVDTNINSYSDAEKDNYIREINERFRESAEILVEISKNSDQNHAAAVTYYNMLVDLHESSLNKDKVDK